MNNRFNIEIIFLCIFFLVPTTMAEYVHVISMKGVKAHEIRFYVDWAD